jgi:hypothetical protein
MVVILQVEEVAFELTLEERPVLSLEVSTAIHFPFFPVTGELVTLLEELELTESVKEVVFEVAFVLVVVGQSLLALATLFVPVPQASVVN